MSTEQTSASRARVKPRPALSAAWLLPIVALVVGAWMIFQHLSTQGPLVELELATADSLETGKTEVRTRSVKVGVVETIHLSKDRSHVKVLARIEKSYEDLLREDTQFWVVKPRINTEGVSGLGTLLSGAYIELQPGNGPGEQHHFKVLAQPPVTSADAKGMRVELVSQRADALSIGDPVYYQGFDVGRVETTRFDWDLRQLHYQVFIAAPYDRLVTANTLFWIASGVQVSLSADGFKVDTGPLSKILNGGVAFGVPEGEPYGQPVGEGARFELFADQEASLKGRYDDYIEYLLLITESTRGLSPGAPVEYRGIRVGTVMAVPLIFSQGMEFWARKLNSAVPVLIRIEFDRLFRAAAKAQEDWEGFIDKALAQGMRASLKPGNLLTGQLYVDLDYYPDAEQRGFEKLEQYTVFPSVPSGWTRLEGKVSAFLDKLNALQLSATLEKTGQTLDQVRQMAASVDTLLNQPSSRQLSAELQQSLVAFRQTLAVFEKTAGGLSPSSPAYRDLQRTLDALDAVLREFKPLGRSLNEKPNAIVFDHPGTPDPVPQKGIRP